MPCHLFSGPQGYGPFKKINIGTVLEDIQRTSVKTLFLYSGLSFSGSSLSFLWGTRSDYQQLQEQELCLQNLFMLVLQRIGKDWSLPTLCPIRNRSPVTREHTSAVSCRTACFRITEKNVVSDALYPRPLEKAQFHVQVAFLTFRNSPIWYRSQTD